MRKHNACSEEAWNLIEARREEIIPGKTKILRSYSMNQNVEGEIDSEGEILSWMCQDNKEG